MAAKENKIRKIKKKKDLGALNAYGVMMNQHRFCEGVRRNVSRQRLVRDR